MKYNKEGEIHTVISPGQDTDLQYKTEDVPNNRQHRTQGDIVTSGTTTEVTLPNGGTVRYTYENDRIVKVTIRTALYVTNSTMKRKDNKQYDSEGNLTVVNTTMKNGGIPPTVPQGCGNTGTTTEGWLRKLYKDGTLKYTYDKSYNRDSGPTKRKHHKKVG